MFFLTTLLATASAANLYVCASGCDSTTIQGAIDASSDGDKVWIAAGTYSEQLTVDHHVFLLAQSSSMNTVVVEGDGTDTLLEVTADGFAQVRRIDFTDGGGDAAIINDGELRLVKSHIYGNEGVFGAIMNYGTMWIRVNSVVSGNATTSYFAGGITSVGDLQVDDCTFLGNDGYNGGAIANIGGDLDVDDSSFTANDGYLGGAIHNSLGAAVISDSSFSTNYADSLGGAWSNHNLGGTVTVSGSGYAANSTGSGSYEDCYDVNGGCTP